MRALSIAAPLLLALTACIGDGLPDTERVGLVSIRTFDNSGTPVVRGTAVFYNARGLQLLPAAPQECALFAYSPTLTSDNAGVTLNAGANISFTIGGFSEVAVPAFGSTYPVYNFAAGSYLDFSTGDSALVSIPGATGGFETMSVKARLAEAFVADTLPTYVENTPMDLSWEPATFPGSIMVVSLRYNAAAGAIEPNVEVACAFEDDGSAQIPANFVNAYGTAERASQDHQFIRVRDRIVEFDSRTRTRVRSIFEYPTRPLATAP